MISSISLTNFQSHPDTKLDFHQGINAIIGSSDSGKSSILRALNWAINNRPVGESFISYWAKDEKGKQNDNCYVNISKNNKILARFRSKEHNCYNIDGKEFEAIGMDVPEEVNKFFNLSEVNIQKQLDSPFLLSSTPGEVARFFNKIIKLDEIDKALSLIDQKKRSCKTDITRLLDDGINGENELAEFNWIDKAEPILKEAEEVDEKIIAIQSSWFKLGKLLQEYNQHNIAVKRSTKIAQLEGKLKEIELIQDKIVEKKKTLDTLEASGTQHILYSHRLNEFNSVLKTEQPIERAIKLYEKIEKLDMDCKNYSLSLYQWNNYSQDVPIYIDKIKELKAKMPDVCPMCGKPMKEE